MLRVTLQLPIHTHLIHECPIVELGVGAVESPTHTDLIHECPNVAQGVGGVESPTHTDLIHKHPNIELVFSLSPLLMTNRVLGVRRVWIEAQNTTD